MYRNYKLGFQFGTNKLASYLLFILCKAQLPNNSVLSTIVVKNMYILDFEDSVRAGKIIEELDGTFEHCHVL